MIQCAFEHGKNASLRHVTVGTIVINKNQEILLVKRAAHLVRGGFYTIPGGFLDRDEDTQTAALRELREETGYEGTSPLLFCINTNPNRPKEDRQNVDFLYLVQEVTGEKKDNSEVTQITWFRKEDLPSEDAFAFDHRESILLAYAYLTKPFVLPLIK